MTDKTICTVFHGPSDFPQENMAAFREPRAPVFPE